MVAKDRDSDLTNNCYKIAQSFAIGARITGKMQQ